MKKIKQILTYLSEAVDEDNIKILQKKLRELDSKSTLTPQEEKVKQFLEDELEDMGVLNKDRNLGLDDYEAKVAILLLTKFSDKERKMAGLTVNTIIEDLSLVKNEEGEYDTEMGLPAISMFWESETPIKEAVEELYLPYRNLIIGHLGAM